MPIIKSKSVQPANTIPHAQGVLLLATADIAENQLLQTGGPGSPSATMLGHMLAEPALYKNRRPRWIAKNTVKAGEYVIGLPWKVVTVPDMGAQPPDPDAVIRQLDGFPASSGSPPAETSGQIIGVVIDSTHLLVDLTTQTFGENSLYQVTTGTFKTLAAMTTIHEIAFDWIAGDILSCVVTNDVAGNGPFKAPILTVSTGTTTKVIQFEWTVIADAAGLDNVEYTVWRTRNQ
jgi:hypothetical protein